MATTARKRNLCAVCNTRTVGSGGKQYDTQTASAVGTCGPCYEYAGYENQHSDSGHDDPEGSHSLDLANEMDNCWVCHPELNMAAKDHKPRTSKGGSKGASKARKPQLNHRTQCTHPQTPEARRECRKAYWANINKEVEVGPVCNCGDPEMGTLIHSRKCPMKKVAMAAHAAELAADRSNEIIQAAKIEAPVIEVPKYEREHMLKATTAAKVAAKERAARKATKTK